MGGAIVTGGDSGIGRASVECLAAAGFDLGVTYRSDEDGARAAADLVAQQGRRAEIRQMDLSELPSAADAVDELAEALGGVDVLVNNAGVGPDTSFMETDLEGFRAVLEVDLLGAFECGQRAARRMTAAGGGRIINITSIHEQVPLPAATAYCAAKAGLGMLTKSMALELAEHGIAVNAVGPGEIATPMTGQHEADPADQPRAKVPAGRPGHAREIGEIVAFLASSGSTYVTGQTWIADGGLTLTAAVRS